MRPSIHLTRCFLDWRNKLVASISLNPLKVLPIMMQMTWYRHWKILYKACRWQEYQVVGRRNMEWFRRVNKAIMETRLPPRLIWLKLRPKAAIPLREASIKLQLFFTVLIHLCAKPLQCREARIPESVSLHLGILEDLKLPTSVDCWQASLTNLFWLAFLDDW